jgi:valyl-tRNA synthetase
MDPHNQKEVNTAFHKLHDDGLIYKGSRMINWCPSCKTALSDAEVEYCTISRPIWTVRYGDITVATTRPETIFGDTAVAVHPNDKRYKKLIGSFVPLPLTDRKIPVIADESVDMKFGTGAVKITPAHDNADYEVGIRHKLPMPKVIDDNGKLTGELTGKYAGLDIMTARKAVVTDLESAGLIVGKKQINSSLGECYRCHNTVEPTISQQWFVKMKELAQPAIDCLNNGLTILPKKFQKIYLHWLNNIKDWCISRQILSGHRIPIDGETDVLDTWFSSALWPFSTLNGNSDDFNYFYPTQTMVTAYDIIFFWVIRMVFSGIYHTGKLPFDTVLLHGLVRDTRGRKMSKSLGNGIDPSDIIEKYGADVLRFSLICGSRLDRDPRYGTERAIKARNFTNKIWNAVKFWLKIVEENGHECEPEYTLADKWMHTKLNSIIKSTTRRYEKFEFGVAANELQNFFWNDFCDVYIEECKKAENKKGSSSVLLYTLSTFMKLINPIMPYITQEIWETFGFQTQIAFEKFPVTDAPHNFPKEAKEFNKILQERKNKNEVDNEIKENIDEKIAFYKNEIARCEKLLANTGFVAKAPKDLIQKEREKLAEYERLLYNIT